MEYNISKMEPNQLKFAVRLIFSPSRNLKAMKITQHKTRWLSRLMLVVALFAQGILAANACVSPSASAVQALAMERVAEPMPCHEAKMPNVNECLMHCTQSDQVNVDQQHMSAVVFNDVVLHVALPPMQYMALAIDYPPLVFDTGPPISIRFCSFLI